MSSTTSSYKLTDRLPTRQEAQSLLWMSVFPLHAWATIVFFHQLPSYLLKMSVFAALEIFAYALVYILLESILVSGILMLACLALPGRFCRGKWVPQSAIFLLALMVAFLPFQFQTGVLEMISWNMDLYRFLAVGWLALFFGLIGGLSVLIQRSQKVATALTSLVERISILSIIYLAIDTLCIIIILVRSFA
ncbi:MAG: hypothetical protein JXA78_03310 [Anaerolineales bacterium]|nr:hypothetical protein [Anaerolineales bacterium]